MVLMLLSSFLVFVCSQVVKLDPVIEDDAELQRSSKVRNTLRKHQTSKLKL